MCGVGQGTGYLCQVHMSLDLTLTELLSCTNGVSETGFTWSPWDQAAAFSSPELKLKASICPVVTLCPLPLPPRSSVSADF